MKTLFLLALCAAGAGLQAQPPGRGGFIRMHPLLSALDANHDGVIDEAELAKAPEVLRTFDKNGDGKITPDELAPMRRGPEGENEGRSNEDAVEEVVKTYLSFDKNGDGKISKDELPERMQGIFDRADKNKDGFLTADELRAMARAQQPAGGGRGEGEGRGGRGGRGPMQDPIFAALDTNHDGVIDANEIANAASSLKTLDKNNDGKLTEDEVRPNFPGRGRQ